MNARHWHGFSNRMPAADTTKYSFTIFENLPTGWPPRLVRDWLRHPPSVVTCHADTPEEAVAWLRGEYEDSEDQLDSVAHATPKQERFDRALTSLRGGDDLCWGFWIGTHTYLTLAVIGMDRCPNP